jgi:hypothetical protein
LCLSVQTHVKFINVFSYDIASGPLVTTVVHCDDIVPCLTRQSVTKHLEEVVRVLQGCFTQNRCECYSPCTKSLIKFLISSHFVFLTLLGRSSLCIHMTKLIQSSLLGSCFAFSSPNEHNYRCLGNLRESMK